LSKIETAELENTKTKILFSIEPFSTISEDKIVNLLNDINDPILNQTNKQYEIYAKTIENDLNKTLSTEEFRHIKSCFYSSVYSETNGDI
jgi:hypothetical protein